MQERSDVIANLFLVVVLRGHALGPVTGKPAENRNSVSIWAAIQLRLLFMQIIQDQKKIESGSAGKKLTKK